MQLLKGAMYQEFRVFLFTVQVTTSNSPAIGDLSRYPYTLQIFPDENENNYGRVGFINLLRWARIGILFEDVEYFRSVSMFQESRKHIN